LIEDVAVGIVPIPVTLPELLAQPTAIPAMDSSMLLVGDVAYSAAPTSQPTTQPDTVQLASRSVRGIEGTVWPDLPATGQEVEAIAASFQRQWPHGHARVLRGADATESALRDLGPTCRYLHLATHGFFAPDSVKSALAPTTQPTAMPGLLSSSNDAFGARGVAGFHPGLLSGIVLAGANRPATPDQDDGILTALSVEERDLSNVDLAVLSACETGLGQSAGGEGMLGLQRAFQVAGARTVVASLWKVPDVQTQELMARFYDNLWAKKMPKLAALREAQIWLLHGGTAELAVAQSRGVGGVEHSAPTPDAGGRLPPQFWAAFELSGDWR
jgi:CHAT domain-containing protein